MKIKTVLILSLIFILASNCGKDDGTNNELPENRLLGNWYMTNMSGGINEVNCDFNPGDITVVINETIMTSQNNVSQSSPCPPFLTGHSSSVVYSILYQDDDQFLVIGSTESGKLTFESNQFTINTNIKSSSNQVDGFIFKFEKN